MTVRTRLSTIILIGDIENQNHLMKKLQDLDLKNKKYIIFDLDGTLIDSVGVWNMADQRIIKKHAGVTIDLDTIQSERHAFLHENLAGDIYLAYCEHLISKYGFSNHNPIEISDERRDMADEVLAKETDFKPGAVELIRKSKSLGFMLALATITTQVQLKAYSHKNEKMMKQLNLLSAFDLIITGDEVKRKKPDPEIYDTIMKNYDAKKDECLIFEDSYTGVLAGKNAGVEVVNVYDKYADLDREKIDDIADYSISNYQEFIDYLESVFPG